MERNFDKRFENLNSAYNFTLGMIVCLIDFQKIPLLKPCYIVVTWIHNFWTERNFYKRFSKLNSSCFFTPGMIDFIKFTLKKYHFVAQTYQFKLSVWLVHNFLMERNFDKRFENLSSASNFSLELIVFIKSTISNYYLVALFILVTLLLHGTITFERRGIFTNGFQIWIPRAFLHQEWSISSSLL